MKIQKLNLVLGILFLVLAMNFLSAVIVDADYITLYPGEEGRISLNVDNNENFDIESISVALVLSQVPFTSVGSSVRDIDDIRENKDDSVSFTLRASTDIAPGDYDIPYTVKYLNADDNTENFTTQGSFGIRVSAKTDLDFSVETRETAILGKEGQISVEIINQGLGEVKSVSIQVFPQGFELLSADKIFVGSIDSDDSDNAVFDVIFKSKNPTVSAKISYKDFDNNDKVENIVLPLRVYTEDEAIELGLMSKSNVMTYFFIIIVLLVIWYIWRRIKKRRKQKQREKDGR